MEVDTDRIKKIEKFNFNFEQNTKKKSYSETKTELKHILTKSVNRQLISDVPISCLLSGGIDSCNHSDSVKKLKISKPLQLALICNQFLEQKYSLMREKKQKSLQTWN